MSYLKIKLTNTLLISSILIAIPLSSQAGQLVKSVDADGNVTYSDKPVPEAKKVTHVPIVAGPSDTEINAAQQEAQKNISTAKKIDQKNAAELKQQQAKRKSNPPKTSTIQEPDVIYSGRTRKPAYPYIPRPKPKPPQRPGINPPRPAHPIARPRSGGR